MLESEAFNTVYGVINTIPAFKHRPKVSSPSSWESASESDANGYSSCSSGSTEKRVTFYEKVHVYRVYSAETYGNSNHSSSNLKIGHAFWWISLRVKTSRIFTSIKAR